MSIELIISLVKANIVLAVLLTNTILLIWFERKVVAGMQSRVGPDRAGPFGILQTLADALKYQLLRLEAMQNISKKLYLRPLINRDVFYGGSNEGIKTKYNITYLSLIHI